MRSDLYRVVRGQIRAVPNLPCGPGLFGSAPERIGCRQAKRKKDGRAKIQAARGDVSFADRWLMATEANLQPSALIEGPRRVRHALDDAGQSRSDLLGRYTFGQFSL